MGIDSRGSSEGETWGRASAHAEKRRQKRQCQRVSSIPWCLKQACQCLWGALQEMNSARGLNTQIWPWERYTSRWTWPRKTLQTLIFTHRTANVAPNMSLSCWVSQKWRIKSAPSLPERPHSKLCRCVFPSLPLFLLSVSMPSSSPFINIHNMMALTTALHSLISPPLNATLSRCAKVKRHQIKTLINYVATSPTFSGLTFSLPVALMSEPGYGWVSAGLCVATAPAA